MTKKSHEGVCFFSPLPSSDVIKPVMANVNSNNNGIHTISPRVSSKCIHKTLNYLLEWQIQFTTIIKFLWRCLCLVFLL